jgi:hypothetical protein
VGILRNIILKLMVIILLRNKGDLLVSSDEINEKLKARRESVNQSNLIKKETGEKPPKSPDYPRKPRFKRERDYLPFTPVQAVKIFNFNVKNDIAFKRISATANPNLSEDDTINEINDKLEVIASDLGGNAIIKVRYNKRIFNLFGRMKGNGSAVYIKDLNNVERIYPSPLPAFLLGAGWIFVGLLNLWDKDVSYNSFFVLGMFFIFNGFFIKKGYKNKTYFLGIVIFIGLYCAWLMHYLLNNDFNVYSYVIIGFFTVLILALFYDYYNKDKNQDMPWKDEWGF